MVSSLETRVECRLRGVESALGDLGRVVLVVLAAQRPYLGDAARPIRRLQVANLELVRRQILTLLLPLVRQLARLSQIATTRWPELVGMAVGLQLSVDKTTVHPNLEGFALEGQTSVLHSDAWGALDFGGMYRAARAAMRTGAPAAWEPSGRRRLESSRVTPPSTVRYVGYQGPLSRG